MKLIDADKFINSLTKYNIGRISLMEVLECINSQPIAYDVDKVVEQLENEKKSYNRAIKYEKKHGTITEEYQARKAVEVIQKSINIVKSGVMRSEV